MRTHDFRHVLPVLSPDRHPWMRNLPVLLGVLLFTFWFFWVVIR